MPQSASGRPGCVLVIYFLRTPSRVPYGTPSACANRGLPESLVVTHCNLPQDQILLKCLKLNSTSCVQYGSFQKSECFRFPQGSPSELNTPCYAYQSSQTQNLGAAPSHLPLTLLGAPVNIGEASGSGGLRCVLGVCALKKLI